MKKKLLSFILAICLIMPCALFLSACGGNPPDEPHTHNWSTTWSKDTSNHWYECDGCDDTKDKAEHNYGTDTICDTCGYDSNHTHTYGETYLKDESGHWQKCNGCDTNTSKEGHNYNGGDTCIVCGYEKSVDPNPSVPTVSSVRDLEVVTIATNGEGNVTLVLLPDGKNMLIDSGYDDMTDEIEVDELLLGRDITSIDYFVSSNATAFRNGAADLVFQYYEVKNFYKPTIGTGITPSDAYNTAVECAENKADCNIKTIDESSCDIEYTFKDSQNNSHSYKIDFMLPLAVENATINYDCSVVIAIEYQGKVVLITSDASEANIDAYCTKYSTNYDVDVLITSYNYSDRFAIASSGSRGSNFLNKISFEQDAYAVLIPIAGSTGIQTLENSLSAICGSSNLHSLTQERNLSRAIIKITTAGVITITSK